MPLVGLCSNPPEAHHDCHSRPVATGREDANTTGGELAFVLVTGFTSNTGAMATIVVPGLADENECHTLALKINTPKHGCFEYRIATPHADVADAVQDELQDSGIIR
jgi:hypothetical protein